MTARDEFAERILSAIDELQPRPNFTGCARLVDLRARLGSVPADVLTAKLREMDDRREIQLEPDPDRLMLTSDDRRCAIQLGGEAMHLVRRCGDRS